MNRIHISNFQFLGGNTRVNCQSRRCSDAFLSHCKTLVGYYPEIFPSGHNAPNGAVTAIVDAPIDTQERERAFCVYFKKTLTRPFWNVLCFSYKEEEWDMEIRHRCTCMTPDQWYAIAIKLKEDSTEIEIPEEGGCAERNDLPCTDMGIFIKNFPMSNGEMFSLSGYVSEDWRHILQLDAPETPEKSPSRIDKIKSLVKSNIPLGLLLLAETIALLVLVQENQSLQEQNKRLSQTVAKLESNTEPNAGHQ